MFLLHVSFPSRKGKSHTCVVHSHPSHWELVASLAWSEMKETESLSKIQVFMGKVIIGKVVRQPWLGNVIIGKLSDRELI